MKRITSAFILLLVVSIAFAQTLPIGFETGVVTSNFVDFDGGVATVIPNPQQNGINTTGTVAQIVRNGGQVWAGSKLKLASGLDFSTNNLLSMKVFTTAPVGTVVKFKLEGNNSSAEKDVATTVSGAWETLTWDFTATPAGFTDLVFMFDFGKLGNGSASSTFLFDDVEQLFGGTQIDVPVNFEGSTVNYTTTDFGGNVSSLVTDPTNVNNHVIKAIKTNQAALWAGTTIGTPAGFATDLPLSLTDSKMTVRVWSPDANIVIKLKVEDSHDPTHTCETQVNTTVAGGWETLVFDFTTESPGTATLSTGLANGWTYNMASIFFNFGVEGQAVGEKTYYFDDVQFGGSVSTNHQHELEGVTISPNPASSEWVITSENTEMKAIEIYDVQGRQVLFVQPNARRVAINASEFANGIYISRIVTDLGSATMKLMKK